MLTRIVSSRLKYSAAGNDSAVRQARMAVVRQAPRATILYVSEDSALRASRAGLLASSGYQLICAENRHRAVLAAAERSVDIAIVCETFAADEAEAVAHSLSVVCPGISLLRLHTPINSAGRIPDVQVMAAVEAVLIRANTR